MEEDGGDKYPPKDENNDDDHNIAETEPEMDVF